jgi:hypothetical protein
MVKPGNILSFLSLSLLLMLGAPPAAVADQDGCNDAVTQYNSSVDEISSTLRRYTNCVGGSQGRDDCSSEFRRVRNAQGEFESAVSQFTSECN